MIKIAPSILAADFSELGSEIQSINNADFIHIDVMDGRFVPNITIGPCVVASLRNKTDILFDVHLMIENPLKYIESFAQSGSDYISVHIEQSDDIGLCIEEIKKCGKKAGLAISPDTDCSLLAPYIRDVDIITVMSVHPGFGGQKFIESTYEKIRTVSKMIKGKNCLLSVDGGVTLENIGKLAECGITVAVAGNTVFKADDRKDIIDRLRLL